MARKPAPTKAHETETSPADQAFGAARKFVEHLAMLADWARRFDRNAPLYPPGTYGHTFGFDETELADGSPRVPLDWEAQAFNFAEAFIAWYDLTHLLTPTVRTEARRVYPPGAASIKLGTGSGAAPVVPTMPASVVNLLTAFRRVELDATPYPTVIEAVADGLGVYFRNAVYAGRRHPLEPDTERVTIEAKARATARQVAQGKPAEPFGWGADYDDLMRQETRVAVRARLGIKTYGDGQDLMMREWKAQDRARGESALYLLRCDPINFPDLRMQLIREAEAVIAAASKPSGPTIPPELLARLQAGVDAMGAMTKAHDERMARVEQAVTSIGMAEPMALPGPSRTEVVLWEGAAHTDHNIRLARTRSAYLEAHGDVVAALAALKASGNEIARSTFYNHLHALDVAIPRWRESVQLSNPTGNLDGMRNVGTRRQSQDKGR
jgi:hypothetical protein